MSKLPIPFAYRTAAVLAAFSRASDEAPHHPGYHHADPGVADAGIAALSAALSMVTGLATWLRSHAGLGGAAASRASLAARHPPSGAGFEPVTLREPIALASHFELCAPTDWEQGVEVPGRSAA